MKYTTIALTDEQYLKWINKVSIVEVYCKGYTDGKRDKSLDGYYFIKELKIKH